MESTKRVVVKVGTSTLTHENGKVDLRKMEHLVRVLSELMNMGYEVVLVSSGAISVGMGKLNMEERPSGIQEKQALAAIGQVSLMALYEKFFLEYGYGVGQVLLTKFILEDEERYTNARNAFETMIGYRVVPIVNENDVISTYEIEFGDNDTLSAYVAKVVEADLLVILSDIDGFYNGDPSIPGTRLISVVEEINDEIRACAGGAGTRRGTGGMQTKINAAEMANDAGIDLVISNGKYPEKLYDIVKGESVGTLFKGKKK